MHPERHGRLVGLLGTGDRSVMVADEEGFSVLGEESRGEEEAGTVTSEMGLAMSGERVNEGE